MKVKFLRKASLLVIYESLSRKLYFLPTKVSPPKVCSKLTTSTPEQPLWYHPCVYCLLWIYFTPVSSDFIVNFKQVIVCRVATRLNKAKQLISNIDDPSLSIIIQQMVKNSNRWWWVSLIIVLPEFSNW